MKRFLHLFFIYTTLCVLLSCEKNTEEPATKLFQIESVEINGIKNSSSFNDISPDIIISLIFSDNVKTSTVEKNITLAKTAGSNVALTYTTDKNTVIIKPVKELSPYADYQLVINTGLKSESGSLIASGKVYSISTGINPTDKFPRISDDELLTLVQKQTFKYFWDFGHPTSGMARERSTSGNTVTTGGTGFGVMSMIVAAERGFITKNEALERIQKIVTFLDTKTTKYHGTFAHWINGETGATMPFSTYDNGADLVETSLLFQGLLTAKQYFSATNIEETKLRNDITRLWEAIEWNWFQKNNENVLYWHWSPQYSWQMNLKISGWNECLITYVLAASSPTYPISKQVYTEGWTRNGSFTNGATYYNLKLPLGPAYGGPLFFAHYSFLGINPNGLSDTYTNYFEQNKNHSLINYNYCVENPKKQSGYSANCWGLTASDGNSGYSAHSPTNDKGVIAPTAALASFPYTPKESLAALHFFYYKLGDKLWSNYGFLDAFNLSENWFNNQYIAINQGPIIIMIENYRTGLLWELFMSNPEVQSGLSKLGFSYTK
ncbi:MAG: hypothetical protein BWZ00_00117 [Bacteroidetes bacterium ADurb.BinA174]|nr:MAG: hypothetical protein BWZ00_00117 [Bacteroidetes bacterium ADurb.BinA174]